jgi:hypothetical protein
MATLPNIADIRYSGFYLPVFSLVYIHQNLGLPVEVPFPVFTILVTTQNFGFLLFLTLFGALSGHGARRSIYGIEGAKNNPKNRWVSLWYRSVFMLKKKPGKPPRNLFDIVEKIEKSIEAFRELSRLQQLLIAFFRGIRLMLLWPLKIVYPAVALLSTWFLAITAIQSGLEPLGSLLLIGQTVFFVGSIVFARFPTAVPVESVPWIHLSEYHKSELLHQRGDLEFEYGPLDFSERTYNQTDQFIDAPENLPHYQNQDDVNWTISLEETEPEHVVELDSDSQEEV